MPTDQSLSLKTLAKYRGLPCAVLPAMTAPFGIFEGPDETHINSVSGVSLYIRICGEEYK